MDGGAVEAGAPLDAGVTKAATPRKQPARPAPVRDAGVDAGDAGEDAGVDAGTSAPHETSPLESTLGGIVGLTCCVGPSLAVVLFAIGTWKSIMRSRSANTKIIRDVTRPFR